MSATDRMSEDAMRLVRSIAGVGELQEVSSSPRSRVFRAACRFGAASGAPCILKMIRGPLDYLRAHDGLLGGLEAVQADAGGILSGPVAGLPRVLRHELVVFPDGEAAMVAVLSWQEGATLADLLLGEPGRRWRDPAHRDEGIIVMAHVAAALARAQGSMPGRHLVHQDVKPGNIVIPPALIAPGSCAKTGAVPWERDPGGGTSCTLIDLDLAFMCGGGNAPDEGERAPAPHGTPGYAAPEAFEDSGVIRPAFDVYALGVVMCEVLTGTWPYGSRAPVPGAGDAAWRAFFSRPQERALPDARLGLPQEIAQIMTGCLSRNPADRPAAVEVACSFARYVGIRNS